MTLQQVLRELEALGTEQNRKVYRRHGIGGNQYGVSFTNLGKLQKQIRLDHDLAAQLWATGNHDARILATMIANPERLSARLMDQWGADLDNYVLADALSRLIARSPMAKEQMESWIQATGEWTGQAGWNLVAHLCGNGSLDSSYLEFLVEDITQRIHTQQNRVRYAMNGALIAIGSMGGELERKAVAAARRIGKVSVDHGETGCQTPDAVEYIRKAKEPRTRARAPRPKPATSARRASRAHAVASD